MKKQLIFKNEYENKSFANAWDAQKKHLQDVIDAYKATGLPALSCDELQNLFTNWDSLLFDKMTNGEQAHLTIGTGADRGHIAIDKSQAMNMLTKPDWYSGLVANIDTKGVLLRKGVGNNPTIAGFPPQAISANFVIDNDGNLQFADKLQTEISEAGNYYVMSENGNKMFSFVKAIVQAYFDNGIDELQKTTHFDINRIMDVVLLQFDNDNKTFIANTELCRLDRAFMIEENNK